MRADLAGAGSAGIELQGWRPFLVNVETTYEPTGQAAGDATLHIDNAEGRRVIELNHIKPFKKHSRYTLMSERHIATVLEQHESRSFDVKVKYIDGRFLVALLSASAAIFIFSVLCFRAHPLSYLTWGVAYLILVLYVGQVGSGFAQYALCSVLLLLAHVVWFNGRLRFYHALSILLFLSIYPILVLSAHHYVTSGRLQDSELVAVLQTNFQEALDYVTDFIGWGTVFAVCAGLLASGLMLAYVYSRRVLASRSFNYIALVPVLALIVGFGFQPSEYMGFKELRQAQREYLKEIEQWQKQKSSRDTMGLVNTERKAEQDEITVLVIGESLSRHHMGLYGYGRETNPVLSATPRLLVFTDVISNHTQTLQSVTYMISDSYNDQPKDFSEVTSLVNIAKAAGLKTTWLSNQTRLGLSNNWISILASEADTTFFVNETSVGTGRNFSISYDDLLLPGFDEALADKSASKLIVVHLFGSHSTYSKRYPLDFSRFSGQEVLNIREHQMQADERINSYDNSVLYNDYIVG